jgi:hypothetical protein
MGRKHRGKRSRRQPLCIRNQHDQRARQPGALSRRKAIHDVVVADISVGNDRIVDPPTSAREKELLAAAISRFDASDYQTTLLELANRPADAHRLERPAGNDLNRSSTWMKRKCEQNSPLLER